jgi:hypothetical protein
MEALGSQGDTHLYLGSQTALIAREIPMRRYERRNRMAVMVGRFKDS